MNESAHDTSDTQADLALLAVSGLLPVWAHGLCADGAGRDAGAADRARGNGDERGAESTADAALTVGLTAASTAGSTAGQTPALAAGQGPALAAGQTPAVTAGSLAGEPGQPPPSTSGPPEGPAGGPHTDHRSYLPDLVAEACWSAIEAGALLGISPDVAPRALDWLRRSGVVIGLPRAGGTVYPRFQFDSAGKRVHWVVAVVNVWLGTAGDPYAAAVWWLRPGPGGLRPRDLVGTADERRIIDFAAAHISGRVLCAGAGRVPEGGRRVIGGQMPVDAPREYPAAATEPVLAPTDAPAPASIEPIPRGAGIFGRHPRHA